MEEHFVSLYQKSDALYETNIADSGKQYHVYANCSEGL